MTVAFLQRQRKQHIKQSHYSVSTFRLVPMIAYSIKKYYHSTILVHMYPVVFFVHKLHSAFVFCHRVHMAVEHVNDYVKLVYFNHVNLLWRDMHIHQHNFRLRPHQSTCMTKCLMLRQSANIGQYYYRSVYPYITEFVAVIIKHYSVTYFDHITAFKAL